ncbi:MAG: hypothetical protein IKZ78_05235, partial [Firmicutes bacterium]|nr:hypothetical protein [Bacillota bacterium]
MKYLKGKRGIIFVLVLALVISACASLYVFGDDQSDLDKINKERDSLSKELSAGKAKSSQLASEIKSLEQKIYSSQLSINQLEKDINATKAEIVVALEELELKQA